MSFKLGYLLKFIKISKTFIVYVSHTIIDESPWSLPDNSNVVVSVGNVLKVQILP